MVQHECSFNRCEKGHLYCILCNNGVCEVCATEYYRQAEILTRLGSQVEATRKAMLADRNGRYFTKIKEGVRK